MVISPSPKQSTPPPHSNNPSPTRKRYAHSKLGSILHARALHDRFRHLGITAYSLHPGIIKTNLQAADPTLFGTFIRAAVGWGIFPGTISIPDGARTTLFCAVDERAVEGSGGYFVPFGKMDGKGTGKW
jgi:retinol dehydrogenase-12